MVQAIIDIPKRTNQIVNIVKAQYDLHDKSEAISKIVQIYEDTFLDPELKPEFVADIKRIEKTGKFKKFKSFDELDATL
ncbi:MAG: DUF2683 family protein [Candidatus Woesearchaeota archaeon]